jgi:hypothetical protein
MPTRCAARVLIADDDPNTLAAYVLFFHAQGYQTRATADGEQALAESVRGIQTLSCSTSRCQGWTGERSRGRSATCNSHRPLCWLL